MDTLVKVGNVFNCSPIIYKKFLCTALMMVIPSSRREREARHFVVYLLKDLVWNDLKKYQKWVQTSESVMKGMSFSRRAVARDSSCGHSFRRVGTKFRLQRVSVKFGNIFTMMRHICSRLLKQQWSISPSSDFTIKPNNLYLLTSYFVIASALMIFLKELIIACLFLSVRCSRDCRMYLLSSFPHFPKSTFFTKQFMIPQQSLWISLFFTSPRSTSRKELMIDLWKSFGVSSDGSVSLFSSDRRFKSKCRLEQRLKFISDSSPLLKESESLCIWQFLLKTVNSSQIRLITFQFELKQQIFSLDRVMILFTITRISWKGASSQHITSAKTLIISSRSLRLTSPSVLYFSRRISELMVSEWV